LRPQWLVNKFKRLDQTNQTIYRQKAFQFVTPSAFDLLADKLKCYFVSQRQAGDTSTKNESKTAS
jgi:hypothetical protein